MNSNVGLQVGSAGQGSITLESGSLSPSQHISLGNPDHDDPRAILEPLGRD